MEAHNKSLFSFIWKFIGRQPWTFFFISLFSLAWTFDTIFWPYIVGLVIDAFTQFEADRLAVWPILQKPVVWGALLFLIVEIFNRGQGYLLARALPKLEAEIRMEMFDHVQRHSTSYFNTHFAGGLANNIADMTTHANLIITQLLWLFLPVIASCVLGILFFSLISPLFATILGGLIIIYALICFFFTQKCECYEHLHGKVRNTLLGRIVDNLTNNFAVNLFYRFDYEKSRLAIFQKEEQQKNYETKKYVEVMRTYLSVISIAGVFFINGLMLRLWLQGKITTGEVIQIFNMAWNIIGVLWFVGTSIPSFFQSIGIARQALTLMNDPQDIIDVPHARPLIVVKGEIVFGSISFRHGAKQLFRRINLHIKGGERVGVVGHSGAGKSTLVNLILRFYPLEEGSIAIDGQDIAKVTLESLRRQISLIPQDPILFHRSFEENIRYGKIEASQGEILEAAELAHCSEFIKRSPQGYATLVGERGTQLSGGERQRIAIARAILANAPILILDEATSALDSLNEQYIQESLETLMKGRTTLVIAHRLSTLKKMDRILVFDVGKIVEEGSHQEFLALEGSYARLWQMQSRSFYNDKTRFLNKKPSLL